MKRFGYIFILLFFIHYSFGQIDSSKKIRPRYTTAAKPKAAINSEKKINLQKKDSGIAIKDKVVKAAIDSLPVKDSIAQLIFTADSFKQASVKKISAPLQPVKDTSIYKSIKDKVVKAAIDSLPVKDSIARIAFIADSLKQDSAKKTSAVLQPVKDTSTYKSIMAIPYLPFNQPLFFMVIKVRQAQSKDELFYLLCGVVFLIGLVRLIFPKYFQNLFRLFFQTSFRQKQTREQLLQDNFASLLLNLLFIINGGIYIGLLAQEYRLTAFSFWQLILYCAALLAVIYLGKYLFLRFSGWLFNVKEASGAYIFIVFLINKILGILLVPFLLIVAFSYDYVIKISVAISLIAIGALLIYRYLISLGTIRRELKINGLHFFLYLCAVEIIPLLLVYKLLFNYIGNSN